MSVLRLHTSGTFLPLLFTEKPMAVHMESSGDEHVSLVISRLLRTRRNIGGVVRRNVGVIEYGTKDIGKFVAVATKVDELYVGMLEYVQAACVFEPNAASVGIDLGIYLAKKFCTTLPLEFTKTEDFGLGLIAARTLL